jgi:hypothetical protein
MRNQNASFQRGGAENTENARRNSIGFSPRCLRELRVSALKNEFSVLEAPRG